MMSCAGSLLGTGQATREMANQGSRISGLQCGNDRHDLGAVAPSRLLTHDIIHYGWLNWRVPA